MKTLRHLFFRVFKCYRRVDSCFVNYAEGDRLVLLDSGWRIAPEEDRNHVPGMVWLEKVERVRG